MATAGASDQEEQNQSPQFATLFEFPTIKGMLDLTWSEFEDFIQYVFERAGYTVEKVASRPEHYIDLVLYQGHIGGKVLARVEVRRYETANIIRAKVLQFLGALLLRGGAPGFIVTTSDFTKPAYDAAAESRGRATLINGERLLRYITYVRGSHGIGFAAAPGVKPSAIVLTPLFLIEAEQVARRDPKTCAVVAVANSKGGVAKTTTALNLAAALSQIHEQHVLLIDMDGQGSLTEALPASGSPDPVSVPHDTLSLTDFFANGRSIQELVRATRFRRLWLLPAHESMVVTDTGGAANPSWEIELMRAIHSSEMIAPDGTPYQWIIFDTPPAQHFYTRAALASSHFVIIPATADPFALVGLRGVQRTVRTMRALVGSGAKVVYGLVTRWQDARDGRDMVKKLATNLYASDPETVVFHPEIPYDSRIDRAHYQTMEGGVWHLLRGTGPAARAYEALTKGMMKYVRGTETSVADSHSSDS